MPKPQSRSKIFSDRDYITARFDEHEKIHAREMHALEKALQENNRRLDEMNRFREENLEDRGKYLTRTEFFGYLSAAVTVIVAATTVVSKLWP